MILTAYSSISSGSETRWWGLLYLDMKWKTTLILGPLLGIGIGFVALSSEV